MNSDRFDALPLDARLSILYDDHARMDETEFHETQAQAVVSQAATRIASLESQVRILTEDRNGLVKRITDITTGQEPTR